MIEALAVTILQAGYRARITDGQLYGERVYVDEFGVHTLWEPIRANVKAVKNWLGY